MLLYLYLILSLLLDAAITVFENLISSPYDIWKPVLIFLCLFIICLIVHIIVIAIGSLFARMENKLYPAIRWMTIVTVDIFLRLLRIKLHVTGMEKLPDKERFLLVGNHRTIFDPIIGILVFRKFTLAYVSKKENFDIPVGRGLILGCGCLSLDRNDNRSAVKTIIDAANILKGGDRSIGIYPEGGTNRTDEPLLPFRNGAFKIAQKAGVPIVITTMCGTREIKKNMFRRKTDIYVDVLDVIPYSDFANDNTKNIGDRVYSIMLSGIKEKSGISKQ